MNTANITVCVRPAQSTESVETADIQLVGESQGNTTRNDIAVLSVTRSFGLTLNVVPKSSQGVFINKNAGETFEVDLLLESELEDEHTVSLSMNDDFPSGWSYSFKDNGATVTEVDIDYQESKSLVLLITVGSQAVYSSEGETFKALAKDLSDSNVIGQQEITVILQLSEGFELSSINYKEILKPGDSHTFQLNIENKANSDDKFTLSATYPSGWRVVFINGNIFQVEAGRSVSASIQVTVGDDARDGDTETVTISVISEISNQENNQNFVVEVEQGFTDRFVKAFTDLWYIFVFLSLIMGVGVLGYFRQDDDWDDYDYDDTPNDSNLPSTTSSDNDEDDWDDWN